MSNAVNAMHDLPIRFELSKTQRARVANSEFSSKFFVNVK